MRALFLTLVLANAAFFGWARWVDVRPVAGSVSDFEGAAAAPRLTLVHAPAMDRSAQPPRRDPPRAGTGSDESLVDSQEIGRRDASCSSIGPFRSLSEVASAAAVLRAEGFEPTQRVEAGDVWVGYWVSWRGAASREQAEATRLLLAERGLTDTYVLPAGEQSNVLSLGVFTDRRRAERRREEVRLLGLEAEISDRRQAGSVYWIDVEPGESDPAIDPGMLVTDPGRIVRLEVRPCRAPDNPAGEPSQQPAESVAPPPSSEADAAVPSDSVPRDPA